MNQQERRIVEVGYNLLQSYLNAKNTSNNITIKCIMATIYGFNGIANEIIPNYKEMPTGKELFRLGQIWHTKLMNGKINFNYGRGLEADEEDFNVDNVI